MRRDDQHQIVARLERILPGWRQVLRVLKTLGFEVLVAVPPLAVVKLTPCLLILGDPLLRVLTAAENSDALGRRKERVPATREASREVLRFCQFGPCKCILLRCSARS